MDGPEERDAVEGETLSDTEDGFDINPRLTRSGDPDEFEDELTADVAEPDDISDIAVPPGLFRRLLADPVHAPELLAARAVEQFATRAERDVRLLRERNPEATPRQLAVYFKRKYSRAARWEGAGTGAAGLFGLPADLVLLAWIQNRLVLSVAAAYGHDMSDHKERAVEILVIQGVHNSREVARRALIRTTEKAIKKLILRHLRKAGPRPREAALPHGRHQFHAQGAARERRAPHLGPNLRSRERSVDAAARQPGDQVLRHEHQMSGRWGYQRRYQTELISQN